MSDSRTDPPALDGYDVLELIGSGGFADVYLYEQRMPRRRVAVKVLSLPALDEAGRRRFEAEANVMAQLSSHPAIMTVYSAGIAPEGSPYIVMEHCPGGSLGDRFRSRPMPVAEALEYGVLLAGALETAHRSGILHRDVKPANVLLNEYGAPLLTDFGISAAVGLDPISGDESLSVPWSPPEFLAEQPWSGAPSDVYALAATVYSLVAGRAPFETAEGPNDPVAQAERIRTTEAPPVGIAELDEVFEVAMARSPQARYTSALSFGRALQGVQRRLSLAETSLQVTGGATRAPAADRTLHRDDVLAPTSVSVPVVPASGPRPSTQVLTSNPPQPVAPVYDQGPTLLAADPGSEIPPASELDIFESSAPVTVMARGVAPGPRRRSPVLPWVLDAALLFAATLLATLFVRGLL